MARVLASLLLALALAACSAAPRSYDTSSPCAVSEASYACQVIRYHNVSD